MKTITNDGDTAERCIKCAARKLWGQQYDGAAVVKRAPKIYNARLIDILKTSNYSVAAIPFNIYPAISEAGAATRVPSPTPLFQPGPPS